MSACINVGGVVVDHKNLLGFLFEFVFVLDFANDFFDDIFDGDDPGGAAVFIDDDCEMDFLGFELGEKIFDGFGFGNKERFAEDGGEIEVFAITYELDEVLGVENAKDIVEVVIVDGDAGVAMLDDKFFDLREG